MPPEKSYHNGVHDTLLQTISNDVSDIKKSMQEHTKWQQGVIESLAAGNEKFRQLDKRCGRLEDGMDDMKTRDRNLGIISTIGSIIAAALGITIGKP